MAVDLVTTFLDSSAASPGKKEQPRELMGVLNEFDDITRTYMGAFGVEG